MLVVEHQDSCPPALVGGWLDRGGVRLEICRPYLGDALPSLPSYDAVLVLGGEMSANDDDTVAWLGPLKQAIREAVAAETPLLGICLGHQLVAVALGGRVTTNPPGQTVGLQPVGWTGPASDDEWAGGLSGAERAIHWNGDVVVELPPGCRSARRSVPVARCRWPASARGRGASRRTRRPTRTSYVAGRRPTARTTSRSASTRTPCWPTSPRRLTSSRRTGGRWCSGSPRWAGR